MVHATFDKKNPYLAEVMKSNSLPKCFEAGCMWLVDESSAEEERWQTCKYPEKVRWFVGNGKPPKIWCFILNFLIFLLIIIVVVCYIYIFIYLLHIEIIENIGWLTSTCKKFCEKT